MDIEDFKKALDTVDMRERIFLIESPSSEDLYHGRNEGDALAKTLSLGEIEVVYYLVTSDELFDRAIDDIAISFNQIPNNKSKMPFLHISAHGDEDGILLTDGDYIFWEKLSRKINELNNMVGYLELPKPLPDNLSRINISLSSCSAFTNYKKTLKNNYPFQLVVGPTKDVGWCQSLIGFSTFFYKSFVQRNTFPEAVAAMNVAAATASNPAFELLTEHKMAEMLAIAAAQFLTPKSK